MLKGSREAILRDPSLNPRRVEDADPIANRDPAAPGNPLPTKGDPYLMHLSDLPPGR